MRAAGPKRPTTCRCSAAPASRADWGAPPADADIHVFDPFVPQLGDVVRAARARRASRRSATPSTDGLDVWLATSTGLRRRHADRIGKVEITAKTPDFARSSWVGRVTRDFRDIDLQRRCSTRCGSGSRGPARRIELPAGLYEVLLEPSCTADLAIGAYGS